MRTILVISPVTTHPTNAGNRARINRLCEILRDLGHDLYFLHVRQTNGQWDKVEAAWGDRYFSVDAKIRRTRSKRLYRRAARTIWPDAAYRHGLDDWYDPAIDSAIDSLRRRIDPDTVIVEYVFMSRALLSFGDNVLKVLDTHDVFADRHKGYLSNNQKPSWYSCSQRAETRGLNRADAILAIQDAEAAYFRQHVRRPVVTVGHSVDLNPLPIAGAVDGRILAVGSENPINIESLEWFIARVLPKIQQQVATAELAVAGSLCNAVEARSGIRLLGSMDDLEAAYLSAQVVINPMQFGTGVKIKSLEALGYARPLVTTPVGAAGLADGSGVAFLEESDDQAFADRVVGLLADPSAAAELGQAGYRYAVRYNDSITASLISLFGTGVE